MYFYVSFIILSTVVIAGACTNYFQSAHLCELGNNLIVDLFHFHQYQHVSFDLLLPRLLSGHHTGHCMWKFFAGLFKISLCLIYMRSAFLENVDKCIESPLLLFLAWGGEAVACNLLRFPFVLFCLTLTVSMSFVCI